MPRRTIKKRRSVKRRKYSGRTKSLRGGNSSRTAPPKLLHSNPDSNCKVFLCANKSAPTLLLLLSSLERNGFSYEVLGYEKPWGGLWDKMTYYRDATASHTSHETLLIFIDGFDVICIKDSKTLFDRWNTARPRTMPILYSSEQICVGNCLKATFDWYKYHATSLPAPYSSLGTKSKYTNATNHVKSLNNAGHALKAELNIFPNSGFILGTKEYTKTLFHELLTNPKYNGNKDDQVASGEYIRYNPTLCDIDIESMFCRTLYIDRVVEGIEPVPDCSKEDTACFLHFPGSGTSNYKDELVSVFTSICK